MSLLDNIIARLPLRGGKKETEYLFAVNIGPQSVTSCIWSVTGTKISVLNPSFSNYSSIDELVEVLDKLLPKAIADIQSDVEKILFGVPEGWLEDDNLKPPYLKLIREIVRSLELKPLAYVSTSHAMSLWLEKDEGAPATAILIGLEQESVSVTVVRAGKLDGTKVIKRGTSLGEEIERALLSFAEVEVLPSRMLFYGSNLSSVELNKYKNTLLSFPWMSKLSFLHFPKIEVLDDFVDIQSIALAGAIELGGDLKYHLSLVPGTSTAVKAMGDLVGEESFKDLADAKKAEQVQEGNVGFIKGDVMNQQVEDTEVEGVIGGEDQIGTEEGGNNKENLDITEESELNDEDSFNETPVESTAFAVGQAEEKAITKKNQSEVEEYEFEKGKPPSNKFKLPFLGRKLKFILPVVIFLLAIILAYLFVPQATVTIFVEPRVLERDAQVIADPNIKVVDEAGKKIPGQIVETTVSGTGTEKATGKKEIGNSAKGTVVIRNKTTAEKTFSKGTVLSGSNGLKFTLDSPVTVASISGQDGTWGKANGDVSAQAVGPDGNLPTDSDFTIVGFPSSEFIAKSEGNFSGGTSKEVTVVTDADQKKLLATLASDLRKKAKDELQKKLPDKKILEEALTEEITKKSYNKNVNDQASEFTLNMTIKFKGTAYSEADLKTIIGKLVETNIPADFQLNLAESETQSDVSKVEKDGRVIFLARFKAKLTPKIDDVKIKKDLRGKTPSQAAEILKAYENVLSSEIKINPSLPKSLARLPILERRIKIKVELK